MVVGPGLGKRAAREALLCENLLGSESDLSEPPDLGTVPKKKSYRTTCRSIRVVRNARGRLEETGLPQPIYFYIV